MQLVACSCLSLTTLNIHKTKYVKLQIFLNSVSFWLKLGRKWRRKLWKRGRKHSKNEEENTEKNWERSENFSGTYSKKTTITQKWLVVESCPTPRWIAFLMLYRLVYNVASHFNELISPWNAHSSIKPSDKEPSRKKFSQAFRGGM